MPQDRVRVDVGLPPERRPRSARKARRRRESVARREARRARRSEARRRLEEGYRRQAGPAHTDHRIVDPDAKFMGLK